MQLDYASILQGGKNLVPDLRQQLIQDALVKQNNTVFQQQQEDRRAQQIAAQQGAQKEQEFQSALDDALLSGDPAKIQNLRFRFPEFTKGMKDAFDALDEGERRTNLTQMGTIYARAQAGDRPGAAAVMRQRIEADRAAGQDTTEDEQILAGLESTDPVQQRAAIGTVGIMLAAVEPDKFGETYAKLNPSEAKPGIQKEVDYYRSIGRDDLAEQVLMNNADPLVQITGPAGTSVIPRSQALAVPQQQQGGGDPVSSGGGASGGAPLTVRGPELGAAIERTAFAAVPGLQVTSRQRSPEKNKAVGGVPGSYHISGEARDFVPPKGMSMGALAGTLKQRLGGQFDVINEGDHVHVEPASRGGAPKQVRSKQEYDRLPSGASYIAPDGSQRVKS